jgi:hypothetical protein
MPKNSGGIIDSLPFLEIGFMVFAPKDWEASVASAAKYFGWSRADTMGCTISELRWWFARIAELEEKK